MSDGTKIGWTDASWPVVTGCTHLSEGCDNCYAAKLTGGRLKHLPAYAGLAEKGRFNGTVRMLPDRLDWPLRWRKPRKVFVSDMADLFHEAVPTTYIATVFDVMRQAPQHTFQVLTKRHARMRSLAKSGAFGEGWPLPNVWMGISAENQKWADIRIPALLDTPAAVRFVSCEPLLGPIALGGQGWLPFNSADGWAGDGECVRCGTEEITRTEYGLAMDGHEIIHYCNDDLGCPPDKDCDKSGEETGVWCDGPIRPYPHIDWAIAGGESGPGHRQMDIDWLKAIVGQCRDAGVPVFVKQDSGPRAGQQGRIPDDLWVHEFPAAAEAVPA